MNIALVYFSVFTKYLAANCPEISTFVFKMAQCYIEIHSNKMLLPFRLKNRDCGACSYVQCMLHQVNQTLCKWKWHCIALCQNCGTVCYQIPTKLCPGQRWAEDEGGKERTIKGGCAHFNMHTLLF